MLITEKKVEAVEKTYKCEVCGKESEYKHHVEACENRHKVQACEHSNFSYFLETEEYSLDINRKCGKCGYSECNAVDVDDLSQETLKRVFTENK